METIPVRTTRRNQFVDITSEVASAVSRCGVRSGLALVFVPHTTAALTINENADPSVVRDIVTHLDKMVPPGGPYSHCEGNSDAHIKSTLLGSSVHLIVEEAKPVFGTWQGIYFCEFDGPRSRRVFVQVIPAG